MSHLPFMQFYPGDWIRDTQILSLEAQGAWMKILCALHFASDRGRETLGTHRWKQYLGYPDDDRAIYLLSQLTFVATIECRDGDGNVCDLEDSAEITIISNRMIRDEAKRIQDLDRKRRYENHRPTRYRRKPDKETTRIFQKSEVRSHISEEDKTPPAAAVFVLPDWIPEKSWRDFEEHRRKMRTPLSTRAKELAVKQLELLRKEGHEPAVVLDNCIARGWRGIFAPKENGSKPPAPRPRAKIERPPELTEEQIEKNKAFLKDLLGKIGAKG